MTAVSLRPMQDRDFEAMFQLESDVVGADMIALLPRVRVTEPGSSSTGSASEATSPSSPARSSSAAHTRAMRSAS
jgi:hypothetical protein